MTNPVASLDAARIAARQTWAARDDASGVSEVALTAAADVAVLADRRAFVVVRERRAGRRDHLRARTDPRAGIDDVGRGIDDVDGRVYRGDGSVDERRIVSRYLRRGRGRRSVTARRHERQEDETGDRQAGDRTGEGSHGPLDGRARESIRETRWYAAQMASRTS